MNISTDFAPPFKLILPYFLIGIFAYLASIVLLFFFHLESLNPFEPLLLSWIHLYLLGFVMMVIFGAMAQLIPVVLEIGHFAIALYYVIYPLLTIGVLMMVAGFYWFPMLLSFGGTVSFVAFAIFLLETFMTILKIKKINFVMFSVIMANIFLLLGLIFGIILALNYGGFISINLLSFLKAHVFLVLIGYVGVTIMGMSLVLLPMFWLSHNFSWIYVKIALALLTISIASMTYNGFFPNETIEDLSYIVSIFALGFYFFQIFIIYKKRVRLEKDIYFKSIVYSYFSLLLSLIFYLIYHIENLPKMLLLCWWFGLFGFIGFIIMGHLYKIVPFLVWYERFSIHVGTKKVPMLADLVPTKSANIQFLLQVLGTIFVAISIYTNSDTLLFIGALFLLIGATIFIKDILFMINFKESDYVH